MDSYLNALLFRLQESGPYLTVQKLIFTNFQQSFIFIVLQVSTLGMFFQAVACLFQTSACFFATFYYLLSNSVHDTADICNTSPFLWMLVVTLAGVTSSCLSYHG
jgi:hypothetical protein